MNKSKYINSEKCRECGSCCNSFNIFYEKAIQKVNPNFFSEVRRFDELDSNGKIEVIEHKDTFEVKFNFPCKHLIKEDNKYSCDIYDSKVYTRPLLCEEYPYDNTTKEDCPYMEKK
jgi:hypothetical protein